VGARGTYRRWEQRPGRRGKQGEARPNRASRAALPCDVTPPARSVQRSAFAFRARTTSKEEHRVEATEVTEDSNTPILQYSNTPILQYSDTPLLRFSANADTFGGRRFSAEVLD
jgi:hypothetical protein